MEIIKEILYTQEFITLPAVVTKVLKLLQQEEINVPDVAKIIETDPSLTVKILKIANSSMYSNVSEVTTVQKAIITLGLSRLKNMVLGISIYSKFMLQLRKDLIPYFEQFWWHVASTSMVIQSFAKKAKCTFQDDEFISALLHDIGKLALLQYDSDKFLFTIRAVADKNLPDTAVEKAVFGCTHAEVGYHIAKEWGLNDRVAEVIRGHHNPKEAESFKLLIASVRLVDLLCEVWGASFYENINVINLEETDAWQTILEVKPELAEIDFAQFTFELETEFKKSKEFLKLITD